MPVDPVAKPLKGWITLAQAADQLGLSKQAVHKMANKGHFRSLSTLGDKRIYCVEQKEVDRIKVEREAAAEERERKRQEAAEK